MFLLHKLFNNEFLSFLLQIKSVFVIVGSNTSNVLSLFKVSDGHLKLSGTMV